MDMSTDLTWVLGAVVIGMGLLVTASILAVIVYTVRGKCRE